LMRTISQSRSRIIGGRWF